MVAWTTSVIGEGRQMEGTEIYFRGALNRLQWWVGCQQWWRWVDGLRRKRGESGITPQSFWIELLWGPWWYLQKDWEGLGEVWASLLLLFSLLVVSDYLPPHGLQHARLPCPSPSPGACSNSEPFSQWCNPAISSSVIPFFSRLQSFPASGSFQMSRLFTSGGQSIGVSASASVLPKNIQDWFPLGLTGLISLRDSLKDSQGSSPTPQFKSINSPVLCGVWNGRWITQLELVKPATVCNTYKRGQVEMVMSMNLWT